MLAWLSRRSHRRRNARELYGSIVTQARVPTFYTAWGVPDTVAGRFEMLVVHVSLVLARLSQEGRQGGTLARALSEAFIADMDANMREMTFGDLAVPREIKRAAAALFDRHEAYRGPLAARQPALLLGVLEAQLAYLVPAGGLDAERIAHYMLEAADGIGGQPARALLAGRLGWPVPTPQRGRGGAKTQDKEQD
jgi:cytochrome b pre-mRNA-processing protein 3